ncbi:unnamed protein product [Notodromas monacha]|uniref:ATP synthase subunit s-like protein n=1 Tax=Notodromas monacha TaxID=399045 RepID=A0A7R9GDP4_9CRUS|nr:unnamed protein product [Notodromas monacha]CAG0918908.1 unnamed protein product [Notodromas monacha]
MRAGKLVGCVGCSFARRASHWIPRRHYKVEKFNFETMDPLPLPYKKHPNDELLERTEGYIAKFFPPGKPYKKHPNDELLERTEGYIAKFFPPGKFVSIETLNKYQSSWDVSVGGFRRWYARREYQMLLEDQQFIEQRHSALGYDLASAHFLLHRFGSVKFVGKDWLVAGENADLPEDFDRHFRVEAIDISGTQITYEGLENLMQLRHLRWLNLSDCPHVDDFCMDQITAEYEESLEYLDISGCKSISERGVAAVVKLKNLKMLKMDRLPKCQNLNLLCLMLEDVNPNLKIEAGVNYMDPVLLEEQKVEYKFLDPPPPELPFLWLNLSDCPHVDDFCMDQITAEYEESLEYLDISGCKSISDRGVAAVVKLKNLKMLKMDRLPKCQNLNLLCLMLEDVNPNLKIEAGVNYMDPVLLEEQKVEYKFLDPPPPELPFLPNLKIEAGVNYMDPVLLEEQKVEYKFLDPPPPELPFLSIHEMNLDPERLIMHKIDFHYEIEPRLSAHLMLGDWVPPGYENYVPPPNLRRILAVRNGNGSIQMLGKMEDLVQIGCGNDEGKRQAISSTSVIQEEEISEAATKDDSSELREKRRISAES